MITRTGGVSKTRKSRTGVHHISKSGDVSMKVVLSEIILAKYSIRLFDSSDDVPYSSL